MKGLSSFSGLVVLIFLASHTSLAQWDGACRGTVTFDSVYTVTIGQSLPSYRIRLTEREDTSSEDPRYTYEITVSEDSVLPSAQVICGESFSAFWQAGKKEYPGIEFLDLNFDGFTDIKMFNALSANGHNKGHDVYVFNPATRAFSPHAQLSTLLGGSYVELDSTKRQITTGGLLGCGGDCWHESTYQVRGDSLVLVREVSQDQDAQTGELYHIVRELVDGVLTVISKEKVEQ